MVDKALAQTLQRIHDKQTLIEQIDFWQSEIELLQDNLKFLTPLVQEDQRLVDEAINSDLLTSAYTEISKSIGTELLKNIYEGDVLGTINTISTQATSISRSMSISIRAAQVLVTSYFVLLVRSQQSVKKMIPEQYLLQVTKTLFNQLSFPSLPDSLFIRQRNEIGNQYAILALMLSHLDLVSMQQTYENLKEVFHVRDTINLLNLTRTLTETLTEGDEEHTYARILQYITDLIKANYNFEKIVKVLNHIYSYTDPIVLANRKLLGDIISKLSDGQAVSPEIQDFTDLINSNQEIEPLIKLSRRLVESRSDNKNLAEALRQQLQIFVASNLSNQSNNLFHRSAKDFFTLIAPFVALISETGTKDLTLILPIAHLMQIAQFPLDAISNQFGVDQEALKHQMNQPYYKLIIMAVERIASLLEDPVGIDSLILNTMERSYPYIDITMGEAVDKHSSAILQTANQDAHDAALRLESTQLAIDSGRAQIAQLNLRIQESQNQIASQYENPNDLWQDALNLFVAGEDGIQDHQEKFHQTIKLLTASNNPRLIQQAAPELDLLTGKLISAVRLVTAEVETLSALSTATDLANRLKLENGTTEAEVFVIKKYELAQPNTQGLRPRNFVQSVLVKQQAVLKELSERLNAMLAGNLSNLPVDFQTELVINSLQNVTYGTTLSPDTLNSLFDYLTA